MQTATDPRIDIARHQAEMGLAFLKETFQHVPDDKLTYSPAEGAKSPIMLIAHCAMSNQFFTEMLKGEDIVPDEQMQEGMAKMREQEASVTDRNQALQMLDESHAALMARFDELKPEDLDKSFTTPFGQWSVGKTIWIPGMHYGNHASQIDYIQTCYGDQEWHFPEM